MDRERESPKKRRRLQRAEERQQQQQQRQQSQEQGEERQEARQQGGPATPSLDVVQAAAGTAHGQRGGAERAGGPGWKRLTLEVSAAGRGGRGIAAWHFVGDGSRSGSIRAPDLSPRVDMPALRAEAPLPLPD